MTDKSSKVPFVHLHCHTDYSLYDGFQTIEEMVGRAIELNFSSIAITDHGKVSGFIKFSKECKRQNIKPIFGIEAYIVDSLQEKKGKRYHLVLLAKNKIGYENILKLSTISHKNSYRGFPRATLDILKKYRDGLIVLSGCAAGQVPMMIREDNILGAEELAKKYKDIFGEDYYLEIMWTHFRPQVKIIKRSLEIGKKLGISVVASNDCHYARREDSKYRIIKMEISRNRPIPFDDCPDSEYYIKSYEEMKKTLKGVPEECLFNTVKIADKCNVEIELGKAQLPTFVVPVEDNEFNQFKNDKWGKTDEEMFLTYIAEKGLKEKGLWEKKEYRARLNKELETIRFTGFVGYFLVVWDYIKWARSKNIRIGAGRGSCVGSLVIYCLNITSVDPVKYNLSMDRFLYMEAKYRAREMDFFENAK